MKQEIESNLSKQLDDQLYSKGFSILTPGKHFVRNINHVFHVVQIVLDKGTSRSEAGYRIKLFADIWSPYLVQSIAELNSFPSKYEPLVGGQVSKVRVCGNGFIDIDKDESIDSSVQDISQLIESMVLPWFELFYDIKSTKNVLSILSTESNEKTLSNKELATLNEKFPCLDSEGLGSYKPSNKTLDSLCLTNYILPIFSNKLSTIGFKQQTSDGKALFVKEIHSNTYCSISFELMDAAFLRVWVHIIKPEMLPYGYWEQLTKQYILPPLIGRPVNVDSICILRTDHKDIRAFIDEKLMYLVGLLSSKEGAIDFIKEVIPGGLLGRSLGEVLETLE